MNNKNKIQLLFDKNRSLINRIKSNNFTKSTLGGCIVDRKDNFISITKEHRANKVKSTSLRPYK